MTRTTLVAVCVCASVITAAPALAVEGRASDPSARQLADDAKKELLDATSLHITVANRSDTGRDVRTPARFDLRLDEDGNCAGSLRMGVGGANGGTVDLVKRGDEVWMKPDSTFWKTQVGGGAGDLAAQLFDGKYVHGTTDDEMLKSFADTCDLDAFRAQLDDGSAHAAQQKLSKGAETEVDGVGVVPLTGSDKGSTITMYITTDAPHRLVKATEKGSTENLTMTLTDYDKPVPSATPPASESVDISKLNDVNRNETPPQA
ncbi:hypothetical protein ABII15_01750 [Streptomyces sp. HUAS MG91]|uniref:Lipoprotein n=1 Tax=Streptomyces tabacisoli TaxID=3156398 RepID=A0AAU8IL43_9ACTN